jgi:O-antigen ligase
MLNVLLFYATYVAGFIGGIVRNPIFAFVLYEAVYFFHPEQRWWGRLVPDISYSFYVVLLMMFLVLINAKKLKDNKVLASPQFRWMYLFVFLFAVAYFYAVLPERHYDAMINFLKLLIIMSLAYKLCSSREQLDYTIFGYIFGAWYVSFMAFQLGRNAGDRVEGIGTVDAPDSNGIAAAIAPSLVLCLYFFWVSKNWILRSLVVLAGVFIANALVLINSRGAFLAVVAGLIFFMYHMYFSSAKRRYQKSTAFFITVAGLAGALYLMDEGFIERMQTIKQTEVNEEQESGATRMVFWTAAWDMAKDHPWGAGYKGFNYYAPYYIPKDINVGGKRTRTVHSSWFEALSEVGYLGLMVFILMLYTSYQTLNKCKKVLHDNNEIDEYYKMIALQGAIIVFIVAMSFLNRMRAEVLYWLILYSACAYNIYVLKKHNQDRDS